MLNHIDLMGRITHDLELKHTNSNVPVISFSIAVDRDFADKASGTKQTDFIDVVAWRHTAEFVSKYFGKGRMITVSGRLQIKEYTDKNNVNRRDAEILADNVYFADSKRDGAAQTGPAQFTEMDGQDDGELPF